MTDVKTLQENPGSQSHVLPRCHNREQLERYTELWRNQENIAEDLDSPDDQGHIGPFPVKDVIDSVFGNSPYLSKMLLKHPQVLYRIAKLGAAPAWTALVEELKEESAKVDSNIPQLMSALRTHKHAAALHIGICDITQEWSLMDVVKHLSNLADICVQTALSSLLIDEARKGDIVLQDLANPFSGSKIFVLALGKLGARELNYSSDIDLMVLFDRDELPYKGRKSPQEFAVKITKSLVKLLDERTADGYVFRTDLRLRPDPASTSIAVSTEAAETYYESWGQNWERAALVKARPIAGDPETADKFLNHLEPFIWRKSLDFYAIQDIHSVKRQIYATKGGSQINVLGHDIKTGRGGIREIEFYVQIQQLIWGGRTPSLRISRTVDGLHQLVAEGLISRNICDDLVQAYQYLRRLEHHLQMYNDEQTQTIPADPDKAEAISTFFGFEDFDAFVESVTDHLRLVESHYADLFEDSPTLAIDGNLVFTGTDHDPDTMKTLEAMGFENPEAISQVIKSWHHGRLRATRSTRSRQILTELTPSILLAFSKTAQPDRAFLKFDQSLAKLPAGVQLFSVFYANPEVLDLIAEIMGDAPRLADYLTDSTERLDYVLDPGFFSALPSEDDLRAEITIRLERADNFEAKLETCVRWTNDMRFRIGVLVLKDVMSPIEGSAALTRVADVVIQTLVPIVRTDFAQKNGEVSDSELAIVGYGKLGSRELSPASDLDLVIVYDAKDGAYSDKADRPLPASAYFIRLAQRIYSALTLMTPQGRLFDVDLRLRPSGDQGPLACSLDAFEKYQTSDAWIWEHLALTRARVVYATGNAALRVETVIQGVLSRTTDRADVKNAISSMRTKLRSQHAPKGIWDVKRLDGGLTDTEFLVLYHALTSERPQKETRLTNLFEMVDWLSANRAIGSDDANDIKRALHLWHNIQWMLRLTLDSNAATDTLPKGLERRLVSVTGARSIEDLHQSILDTGKQISNLVAREFGTS